jgi:ribonuclease VapC
MFLDASAMVAVVSPDEDGPGLAIRIARADRALTSGLALYEATLGLVRSRDMSIIAAQSALSEFTAIFAVDIVPITADMGRVAIEAFARFGRGRHPARLNMGDCFAYACARQLGVPLLFKGNDFMQTDIAAA